VKAYFDTSVLVAAFVADHPHHNRALAAFQMVHRNSIIGQISGHGLSETYAVLTRAPFLPPIYPLEGWKLFSLNVLSHFGL
jgi:predicted nucleic acid-binding protein